MTTTSPTKLTLDRCRKFGWTATVAEYWLPSFAQRSVVDAAKRGRGLQQALAKLARSGPGKRIDLFGFGDVVALTGEAIMLIQCTSSVNQSARVTKIVTECQENAEAWLRSGGKIEVWGWKKYAQKVERRNWRETRREIVLEDVVVEAPF